MLTGLYGKFEPYINADTQKSATLIQSASKAATVIDADAQSRVLSNYIYTLTDNNMQNAHMYDGTLLSLSGGVVVDKGNGAYAYVIENENGQGRKEIAIRVANVTDLSAYVGKSCPVQGVLDIAATYPENPITLILRSTADFLESNVQFESLKDLIAAGEPAGTSVTYELVNPVLVTYKFTKGGGDNAIVSYYAIVQDATEGIVLSLGSEDLNVAVGDSIVGVKGVYSNMRGLTTDILDVNSNLQSSIKVKNSANPITPIEVTLAQLLADKSAYSNRVVLVRGVKDNKVEHTNPDGSKWLEYYFSQGETRMDYPLNSDGEPYFTYYANMDITGIADDRVIGNYYSVWALSQSHIINLDDETAVDNIAVEANIYAHDGCIYIAVADDAEVSVYTLQGTLLARQTTTEGVARIAIDNQNCVIVTIGSKAYKLFVR
jgi:hypothetical protein